MSVVVKKIGEFYRNLVSQDLKRKLDDHSDVFLLNYHRLKSAEMTQLRRDLKSVGASVLVTKNSFMRKIFQDVKKPAGAVGLLDGQMAFVFVKDDPVAVSKVLIKFLKKHEALTIRGGFMSDRLFTFEDVKLLSQLSSRQAVYQQIASMLNAPAGKLATCLDQVISKLAYALKAVSEKKNNN